MARFGKVIVSALLVPSLAAEERIAANPIRKVVNLLQAMQKKVQEEGKKEEDMFEKYMCYCKTGTSDLSASISAAEDKIPAVGSNIEAAEASLSQAKDDLKQAQTDRTAAKGAIAEATALREKEAAAFASFKADSDANTVAIAKAVAALEKGAAGGFLQTQAVGVLRRAVEKSELIDADQQEVIAFLSNGYAPQSGEITGILKQMGDTMAAALADATKTEEAAIKSFEALVAAKKKEIAATTSTIEAKTRQIGELGVSIVQMKEDVADTEASLAEDKKFAAELKKGCSTKEAEWDERSKVRAEELVALADTIKVLNDDDALELFKKTLPSASSFVQVSESSQSVRARALATIRSARTVPGGDRSALELLALSLTGKRSAGGFGKVIKMIDSMVALLGKEQGDDNDKKEYCLQQLDSTEDKQKSLSRDLKDEGNVIETTKEGIATLTGEIASLEAGIKALDKAVAEATEQRRDANAEFKALMASDTAAKEVLAFAKNRLNKFYNPKLYKPPPATEMSREDRIYSNNGGEVTTAAPGGIAGTGVTAFVQISKDAPEPPPETWDAYAKKGGESSGVIAMIDLLIKDLDKELSEASVEEKNDQAEYEATMKDAAEKRTTDTEAFTAKTAAKADLESELQEHTEHKAALTKELMAVEKYTASLHGECDWLLQYFDVRKEARTGEIESLNKAKAVLSGADYSFLQVRKQGFLRKSL